MKYPEVEADNYIGNSEKELIQFIQTIQQRVRELLEEIEVKVLHVETKIELQERLELKNLTALITIEDIVKMAISFSYDDTLIHKIFQEYTVDIEIGNDEVGLMKEESAGDFINVVIGNILAKFQKPGVAIELSIPLIINGARSITRYKKSKVCYSKIETEYGNLYVYCMVPLKMSLQHLLEREDRDDE